MKRAPGFFRILLIVLVIAGNVAGLRIAKADTITEGNLDNVLKDIRMDIETYISNQGALAKEIKEAEASIADLKRVAGSSRDRNAALQANAKLLNQYSRLLSAHGLLAKETIKVVDTLVANFEKLRNHMEQANKLREKVLDTSEYRSLLQHSQSSLASLALNLGDQRLSATIGEMLDKHDRLVNGGSEGALGRRQDKINEALTKQVDFLLDVRASALLASRVIAQQQQTAAMDIEHFKASMALMTVQDAVNELHIFKVPQLDLQFDEVLELTAPKTVSGSERDMAINTAVLQRFANPRQSMQGREDK